MTDVHNANPTTATQEEVEWFRTWFNQILQNVELVVRGKTNQVALVLSCLFAEGHLLLEDVPGTGKTTLAKALAASIRGGWSRIQFTPDLLPSDVTGGMIYDQKGGEFTPHFGPVFSNIVLADEINRASPKTQAALLEVMEERQVTFGNETNEVPRPFVVIATQNPVEQQGTYRLPEAQLDRFLMRTSLGYASSESTLEIMRNTRALPEVQLGASPRGAIAMMKASKSVAAARARVFVDIDDVKLVAPEVLAHRLLLTPEAEFKGVKTADLIEQLLDSVELPDIGRG